MQTDLANIATVSDTEQDSDCILQVTLPKCKSPILIIFEYVIVDVKIRHTYFFYRRRNIFRE